jgi:hypothetical protein
MLKVDMNLKKVSRKYRKRIYSKRENKVAVPPSNPKGHGEIMMRDSVLRKQSSRAPFSPQLTAIKLIG